MKWSYKTVHFELKREGLLGGSFLDETEVEEQLNQYGRSGWELISVIEVQDGIIAFFKQQLDPGFSTRQQETVGYEDNTDRVIDEPYEADHEEFYETEDEYQMPEQSVPDAVRREEQYGHREAHELEEHDTDDHLISEDEYQVPEQSMPEAVRREEQDGHPEAHEFEEHDTDDHLISEDGAEELLGDDEIAPLEDQQSNDELDEQADQRGIGAIRIE